MNPLVVLMFCLSLGFLLGRVKTRFFPANSTLATLFVAISVNLLLRRYGSSDGQVLHLPTELQSLGFAFFSFVIGFSAGPGFWATAKRRGLRPFAKQALMASVFCLLAFIASYAVIVLWSPDSQAQFRGLLAGALSQITILESGCKDAVAYGVAYMPGIMVMILFVQCLAPRMLGVSLLKAVKYHMENNKQDVVDAEFHIPAHYVQMRAYRIKQLRLLPDVTIDWIETNSSHRVEVVAVHPRGEEALQSISQSTKLKAGDVVVVIGDMRSVRNLPSGDVEELTDDRYLSERVVFADVVLAVNCAGVREDLTERGILLRSVVRNGSILSEDEISELQAGDVLQVAGLSQVIEEFVKPRGYLREESAPSDIFSFTLAIGIAFIIGAISVGPVSLGSGCCSLLLGLVLGCVNQRRPDVAHIPSSILLFLRSLGLNLFIAVVSLNAELIPDRVFSLGTLFLVFKAAVIISIPAVGTFFFGRYFLKLPPVALLGGLCGCATCTPALNALEEETGSSVFTTAYTIPYVIANVLLTLMGCVAVGLVKSAA